MPSFPKWQIRRAQGSDLNFIYATWLNSFRDDSSVGKSVRKSIFYFEYEKVLDELLARPHAIALVAVKPDEPNVIFGYLVFEDRTLHYVFVKEDFRNFGIAKNLFQVALGGEGGVTFTHKTNHVRALIDRTPELTYNPFFLYAHNPKESHGEK